MDTTPNSQLETEKTRLSRSTRAVAGTVVLPIALALGTVGFTACQTTETQEPGLYQPAEPQQPGEAPPPQPGQEQPAPQGW